MTPDPRAAATAADLTRRLAISAAAPARQEGADQSLASGAAGISLLYTELALAGLGSWTNAHAWLRTAVRGGVSADHAGLYFGAPAVAFAVHAASRSEPGRYAQALAVLDQQVTNAAHRRIDQALARIARGTLPDLTEFDLINGITGIGTHLLLNSPSSDALERILSYLVRLTEPVQADGHRLPGWWTVQDPHLATSARFPGGHGNFGLAHGICGPLALLSLAMSRGVIVSGHGDAIERICSWLDSWRQDHRIGSWWPQWITRRELQSGRCAQPGPLRPSWCYGTPGVARAQQLAGIATGDIGRQRTAEDALTACLADPAQLALITGSGLCHGWAGLYLTAWRVAQDALARPIPAHLSQLAGILGQRCSVGQVDGLLEGAAGVALAVYTAQRGTPPISGWDRCLLIS